MPDISVIICAYTEKRWHNLVEAIASVQKQVLLPSEIILVIDHNVALLKKSRAYFSEVIVLENTQSSGLSGARNSGIARAKGELIAFLDDDAVATPEWLMLLSEVFIDSRVLGVGGAVIPRWADKGSTWLPEEFHWVVGCTYRGMPQTMATIRNPIGANMSLRREIFAAVGGFRSEIGRVGTLPIGCEETELCIRARQYYRQGEFVYQPAAVVFHYVPANRTSWHYFCARCYCEGLSKAAVARYVGAKDGLASERTHILRTLPNGILRGLADVLLHHDLAGFARVGAIIAGLTITATGFFIGSISTRRADIRSADQDLVIEKCQM